MAYIKEERYDEQTTAAIAEHYREILRLLGEDPEREGLVKTPERVAKALQFLTHGSHQDGAEILDCVLKEEFDFVDIDNIGKVVCRTSYDVEHIDAVLALPLVDAELVKNSSTAFVDTDVTLNKYYAYSVRAINDKGYSAYDANKVKSIKFDAKVDNVSNFAKYAGLHKNYFYKEFLQLDILLRTQ